MRPFDDEIREHFADLSAEDRKRAPEFSALWAEAERRAAAPSWRGWQKTATRRWWLVAAASVVIAGALMVQLGQRLDAPAQAALTDPLQYPSITSWEAPTDGLLRMARAAVVISPSALGSSLDGVARDAVPSSSNK